MSNNSRLMAAGMPIIAALGGALLGWSAQDIHDRLTNPLRDKANWTCEVVGIQPPRTFTSPGATLVIPELTGYHCSDNVIHWRASE